MRGKKLNGPRENARRSARVRYARRILSAGSIGPLGIGVQARHPEPDEIWPPSAKQAWALEERRGRSLTSSKQFRLIERSFWPSTPIRSFSALPNRCPTHHSEEGAILATCAGAGPGPLKKTKRANHRTPNCHAGVRNLASHSSGDSGP